MKKSGLTAIALSALAASTAPGWSQTDPASESLPDGARVEQIVSGLEHPWSLAFLPDGDLLVTEKPGRLRWVDDGVLVEAPVSGTPDVLHSGQGGLLDVVLHPEFETNGLVYLTWSAGTPRANTLHLGRGRFAAGAMIGFEEIFAAEPVRPTDVHYGGRLAFLPDGTLLLGIGDGFDFREEAQRPQSHYGAYVHLHADGAPASQAFEGAPGVYSIGHRNPQAIAVDPATGVIWSNEHGPQGGDEINILAPRANYGWPIASTGINYTGALVTPFETYEGMVDPVIDWVPSIAPGGMVVYRGEMFPEWSGDLLVAALIAGDAPGGSGHIRRVDTEGQSVAGQSILLDDRGWRVRDVRVAPDGSVWWVTDNGDDGVWRLSR